MGGLLHWRHHIITQMISDLDVYRSAQLLVERHGDGAPIEAAMKADAMLEKGDIDGQAAWLRVVKAAEEFLDMEPRGSERLWMS